MMSFEACKKVVQNTFPRQNLVEAYEYDENHFMFTVIKKRNEPQFDDPYYVIDRRTGKVSHILPTIDLEKFDDVINNHKIY